MKPIKIAILSCSHGHAKAYYGLVNDKRFELVGVSVEPEYKGKVFLEERLPNVKQYESDEDLYQNHTDLEAVVIGSANIKHFEQLKVAVSKNLHIFSMKIPTFDMTEYKKMIELTEKANLVCQIELEMREHAEIYRVKQLIKNGEIGKVLSITALNFSHNPVWWRPWQADPIQSYGRFMPLTENDYRGRGGALADHPHIFDLVRFILDSDFETVYAEVAPNIRETKIEELVYVIGKMKNGAVFSLDPSYANTENKVNKMVNWERHPYPVEVSMTVHGTKGSIIADLYGMKAYHNGLPEGRYLVEYLGRGFGKQMNEFYNCIRNGNKPTIGLREHKRTIEVMNACYESIYKNSVIKV